MKFQAEVVVHAVKESKGEYEGRAFSSCTFHCEVDLKENGVGRSIGRVTRPFKFGDSTEFQKWAHLKDKWPLGGILCECEFDVVAGADNSVKLTLLGIKPASTKAPA